MSVASMLSCNGISSDPPAPAPASVYQVVTISDLHFDPLYEQRWTSVADPGAADARPYRKF
jgi:hypothetical protein